MQINGYDFNYSESELDAIFAKTNRIEMIDADFDGFANLSDDDKMAVEHLVCAGAHINSAAMELDHAENISIRAALQNAAATDSLAKKSLELFDSLNGVAGSNGIDKQDVEVFRGLHARKNFYPGDLDIPEFHKILKSMLNDGMAEEVRRILSPRTVVRRSGDALISIDYVDYFDDYFTAAADEIRIAADLTTDENFADFLRKQADALCTNDEELDAAADAAWATLQDCPIEFTVARENYVDEITPTVYEDSELIDLLTRHKITAVAKDQLGVRVGVVNRRGTDMILKFKELMPSLAAKMPRADEYEQSIDADLKQTMVDVDLIAMTGEYAMARGSIVTAQNLPNDDKLSVLRGGGRRNVYHRQVRLRRDEGRTKQTLDALIHSDLHHLYNPEGDHIWVVGHENGHSLGPDNEYKSALGNHSKTIEELKADIISLAFMPEYVAAGVLSADELKMIFASVAAGRFMLKAEPKPDRPHRVSDLMKFNYFHEFGAIGFDDAHLLTIDFDKFMAAAKKMLCDVIDVQLSKSAAVAGDFIAKYAKWGPESARIAAKQQELGVKPYFKIVQKI